MKSLFIALALMIPALTWAGPYVNPKSSIAPNPAYSRTLSLGTKGYANYSASFRGAVRFKAATAAGTATAVKVFFDGDETKIYPTDQDTFTIERGQISKIGFRAYSTATPVTVHVLGQ